MDLIDVWFDMMMEQLMMVKYTPFGCILDIMMLYQHHIIRWNDVNDVNMMSIIQPFGLDIEHHAHIMTS